jgi:hypothetical protein
MPFTFNDTNCGSVTYSITTSGGAAVDSSVITVDNITPSITTYTSDSAKIGAYPLQITGSISGYASKTVSATFTLNIADCCLGTSIISASIPDYTYYVTSLTTDTIASIAWT